MELLRIKHHDFVMTIECTKFDAIWDKAKRNVGKTNFPPHIPGRMVLNWWSGIWMTNPLLR